MPGGQHYCSSQQYPETVRHVNFTCYQKKKKKVCGAEKTIYREITGKVNSKNSKNSKNRGRMSVLLKDRIYYSFRSVKVSGLGLS